MIIAIGTKNRAKVHAVERAFQAKNYQFITVDVASGVSDQPFSDEETAQGALNRATAAQLAVAGQIGIGLEGGVHLFRDELYLCNWGALTGTALKEPIIAGGARLRLPDIVAERILKGEELGPVMESYANRQNIRTTDGAVGIFTNNLVNRTDMFLHVMKLLIGQYEFQMKTNISE